MYWLLWNTLTKIEPLDKIFFLNINDYAYLVPFVEGSEEVFLKTIIPNHKATNTYLRGRN